MRNYEQIGDALTITAPADAASGDVVVFGDSVGVATGNMTAGEQDVVAVEGVYALPKASGTAWNAGDALVWDASAGAFTKASAITLDTGDVTGAAMAAADTASGDTAGMVKLANPGTVQ